MSPFGTIPAIWRWPAAGLAILACAGLSYTQADADLWGHLRFGLDLLDARALTAVDPYSFTQDRPWINHEWLSELQTAIAFRIGGVAGLALLKMVLASAAFWMMWQSLRGVRLNVRLAVLVATFMSTIHITSSIRPQAWTFLFLAVLVRVLTAGPPRARYWLPLLFALWANCHGGWIVGFGVLSAWTVGELVAERRVDWARVTVVVLCLAATLATPYGWRLWEFLASTVRMERSIAEWKPVWTAGAPNWIPWVVATAVAIWASTRRCQNRLASVLVLAMLAYASFRVLRIGSLFVESLVIIIGPVLTERWPSRPLPLQRSKAEGLVAKAMFAAAVLASVWVFRTTLTCIPIRGTWRPEPIVGQALLHAEAGRIVTFFDWGQYALWHFAPRLRVSMDGRRETIYTDRFLRAHDTIVDGLPEGMNMLAQWKPEYVWLPAFSAKTKAWLLEHGYRIDIETERAFLAVRRDLPELTARAATSAPDHFCFPG